MRNVDALFWLAVAGIMFPPRSSDPKGCGGRIAFRRALTDEKEPQRKHGGGTRFDLPVA